MIVAEGKFKANSELLTKSETGILNVLWKAGIIQDDQFTEVEYKIDVPHGKHFGVVSCTIVDHKAFTFKYDFVCA